MAKKRMSGLSKLYQPKNLITAALVGAGVYYAFKWGRKKVSETPAESFDEASARIKREQQAAAATKKTENEQRKAAQAASNISTSDSYKGKVGEIQTILGVAVDGIPGRQTQSAYAKRFGLDRGTIAPMTVQYYLDKAKRDQIAFGL
jgi:hypothetical protein